MNATQHQKTTAWFRLLVAMAALPAVAGGEQGPGPAVSLGISPGAGSLKLTWGANAAGLVLQSAPAVAGPGAVWKTVSGVDNPIVMAGTNLISAPANVVDFYRLGLLGGAPKVVNLPQPPPTNGVPPAALRVVLQPESHLVEIGGYVTFAALVDGYTNDPAQLTYRWEWNKLPYTAIAVTTNLTWRDLQIGNNTNFLTIPNSPTNSNFLTLGPVTTNEVAYYRVTVTVPGQTNSSAPAPLWAWEQTNSVVVWGTPISVPPGSGGGCPGAFTKIIPCGGHWPASAGLCSATGLGSSSGVTWITWQIYGAAAGCNSGGFVQLSAIPTLPYYFTVYTSDPSASNPYPVYLYNFRY